MKYKALVSDIDGTLLEFGGKQVKDGTVQALRSLKEQGVAVILATGRAVFVCAGGELLEGFAPDYWVCSNGAYVVDGQHRLLFEDRMEQAQVEALTSFAEERGYRLSFTFEEAYYNYAEPKDGADKWLPEMYNALVRDGSRRDRHLQSIPFGAHIPMVREGVDEFLSIWPDLGLKMMEVAPDAYDICRVSVGKSAGVGKLLEQLGISWEETIAFGDSENDMGMLRAAGLGVAMGSARQQVKEAADHVTGTAEEDGVLDVIRKVF